MSESAKRHEENTNLIKEIWLHDAAHKETRSYTIKTFGGSKSANEKGTKGRGFGKKEKDPGSFTLPCFINNVCFDNALADIGASISVMPLSAYHDAKYEHVGQDTRSYDGKDDKDKQGKDLKISESKTKSKGNDKGSRSKIANHEGTSLQRRQRPRSLELNDKSNLIDLMKECHNELTLGEIVSLKILSRTMKSKPKQILSQVRVKALHVQVVSDFELLTEMEHEEEERCEVFDDHERLVCYIRRFKIIKFSFKDDEEYASIKENEYDDLTNTSKEAIHAYQEIFRMMDEGWKDLAAKKSTKLVKCQSSGILCVIVVMLEYIRIYNTHPCS
ncbi:hypothetical protein Tco_0536172 [Tanacetum coccineum]